jgi:hypothetical protein
MDIFFLSTNQFKILKRHSLESESSKVQISNTELVTKYENAKLSTKNERSDLLAMIESVETLDSIDPIYALIEMIQDEEIDVKKFKTLVEAIGKKFSDIGYDYVNGSFDYSHEKFDEEEVSLVKMQMELLVELIDNTNFLTNDQKVELNNSIGLIKHLNKGLSTFIPTLDILGQREVTVKQKKGMEELSADMFYEVYQDKFFGSDTASFSYNTKRGKLILNESGDVEMMLRTTRNSKTWGNRDLDHKISFDVSQKNVSLSGEAQKGFRLKRTSVGISLDEIKDRLDTIGVTQEVFVNYANEYLFKVYNDELCPYFEREKLINTENVEKYFENEKSIKKYAGHIPAMIFFEDPGFEYSSNGKNAFVRQSDLPLLLSKWEEHADKYSLPTDKLINSLSDIMLYQLNKDDSVLGKTFEKSRFERNGRIRYFTKAQLDLFLDFAKTNGTEENFVRIKEIIIKRSPEVFMYINKKLGLGLAGKDYIWQERYGNINTEIIAVLVDGGALSAEDAWNFLITPGKVNILSNDFETLLPLLKKELETITDESGKIETFFDRISWFGSVLYEQSEGLKRFLLDLREGNKNHNKTIELAKKLGLNPESEVFIQNIVEQIGGGVNLRLHHGYLWKEGKDKNKVTYPKVLLKILEEFSKTNNENGEPSLRNFICVNTVLTEGNFSGYESDIVEIIKSSGITFDIKQTIGHLEKDKKSGTEIYSILQDLRYISLSDLKDPFTEMQELLGDYPDITPDQIFDLVAKNFVDSKENKEPIKVLFNFVKENNIDSCKVKELIINEYSLESILENGAVINSSFEAIGSPHVNVKMIIEEGDFKYDLSGVDSLATKLTGFGFIPDEINTLIKNQVKTPNQFLQIEEFIKSRSLKYFNELKSVIIDQVLSKKMSFDLAKPFLDAYWSEIFPDAEAGKSYIKDLLTNNPANAFSALSGNNFEDLVTIYGFTETESQAQLTRLTELDTFTKAVTKKGLSKWDNLDQSKNKFFERPGFQEALSTKLDNLNDSDLKNLENFFPNNSVEEVRLFIGTSIAVRNGKNTPKEQKEMFNQITKLRDMTFDLPLVKNRAMVFGANNEMYAGRYSFANPDLFTAYNRQDPLPASKVYLPRSNDYQEIKKVSDAYLSACENPYNIPQIISFNGHGNADKIYWCDGNVKQSGDVNETANTVSISADELFDRLKKRRDLKKESYSFPLKKDDYLRIPILDINACQFGKAVIEKLVKSFMEDDALICPTIISGEYNLSEGYNLKKNISSRVESDVYKLPKKDANDPTTMKDIYLDEHEADAPLMVWMASHKDGKPIQVA